MAASGLFNTLQKEATKQDNIAVGPKGDIASARMTEISEVDKS